MAYVDKYNCDCAGEFPSDTLANIRTKVLAALGFVDPVTAFSSRTETLSTLRDRLATRIGLNKPTAGFAANIQAQLDDFLNQAQQQFFSRVEQSIGADTAPAQMVLDTDSTTLDYVPIFSLALGMAKASYGQADASLYFEEYKAYIADLDRRQPANATSLVNNIIIEAQESLYRRYRQFQTGRWYSWPIVAGTRFYDLAQNQETCTKRMDAGKVEWVGISQGDNNWQPLVAGIDPMLYYQSAAAIPAYYDIRQCIEIWPVPNDNLWTLRVKGNFGLLTFAVDTDTSTVDPNAIYLQACLDAKAYYGQKDAPLYQGRLETYIGDQVKGSHLTKRYIPGETPPLPYAPPKILGLP